MQNIGQQISFILDDYSKIKYLPIRLYKPNF